MKIICWIKTIYRTGWDILIGGIPIMGHDYIEQEDGSLLCDVCKTKTK